VAAQGGLTVNFTDVHQHIDGFGASDAFLGALTDAQADLFFSPTLGIGLTFLRTGISSTGATMGAYSNAVKAAARGAQVWATPWTAPAAYKDNGSLDNGGNLLAADYSAWASILAGFQATMIANGGPPLYAISVQNEPDFSASYVSMLYTNQAMDNFIQVLGPKLAALTPAPKLIMPEVASWGNAWGFSGTVLGDSVAAPYLSIVAAHQYGGVSAPQTTARPIWETEQSSFEALDPSIANGLMVAQWINDAITIGNVSAWHYWWLIGQGDDQGILGSGGTVMTKRYSTIGNFSKFVRPGFMVVGVTGAPSGTSVTAYENQSTRAFVIVAINQNGSTVPLNVSLSGLTASAVTPWVTSSSLNLAQQSALAVSGGSFTATLAASSVTSFVGSGATTPSPSAPTGLAVQ
jgi:glucuronoarabinoxylan endo-1,4-beta-xylanase